MANDLNLCQFIGRLGQDPEVRFMPNGTAVANLSIAVSSSWKDQQGQKQERTEWIRCVAYKKLAEIIGEYIKKGSQIYISGRQATRKWQDQQGQDRYSTEIIVEKMQMLGGNNANSSGGYQQQNRNQQPQGGYQQSTQNAGSYQQPAQNQGGQQANQPNHTPMAEPDFDFDDDIPFAPIGLQYRGILNAM